MSTFQVRFDVRALVQNLDAVSAQVIPGAVRRAIKRTVNSAKVAMSRDIAQDMNLKVGFVKNELKTAVTETPGGEFVGQLSVSGRRIPLIQFSAKGANGANATNPVPSAGRGRGVSARVGAGRQQYRGAFIARMNSGHVGVFKRVGSSARKSRGAWSKNLPIIELHGPSLPHVFAKKAEVGLERAREQMTKELQHEIAFALQKLAS